MKPKALRQLEMRQLSTIILQSEPRESAADLKLMTFDDRSKTVLPAQSRRLSSMLGHGNSASDGPLKLQCSMFPLLCEKWMQTPPPLVKPVLLASKVVFIRNKSPAELVVVRKTVSVRRKIDSTETMAEWQSKMAEPTSESVDFLRSMAAVRGL